MIKRYSCECNIGNNECPDGEYVKYADHKKTILKRIVTWVIKRIASWFTKKKKK